MFSGTSHCTRQLELCSCKTARVLHPRRIRRAWFQCKMYVVWWPEVSSNLHGFFSQNASRVAFLVQFLTHVSYVLSLSGHWVPSLIVRQAPSRSAYVSKPERLTWNELLVGLAPLGPFDPPLFCVFNLSLRHPPTDPTSLPPPPRPVPSVRNLSRDQAGRLLGFPIC